MKVKELKAEGLKKKYQVVVENKDFEAKVEEIIAKMAKSAKLPGFRPGKAPKEMLKQKYRANALGEALDSIINSTADQIVKDNKLELALRPDIKITKFEDGSDVEFEMNAEVLPEIKVIDFSEIKLEKFMSEVPAEEVEKAISYISQSRKETSKVEDASYKAQKNDTIVIDFAGSIDGVELQGGKGEGYPLVLGSGTFIPGFEDQLMSAKVGDKVDVKVKFPDNYHAKDLAGKDAVFAVEAKEVRQPKEVVIDDEFAKSIGEKDLAGLKDSIKGRIKSDYENASRMKLKRQLLDKMDSLYKIEVPESLVEEEFKSIEEQYQHAKKVNQLDEHEKNTTEKELMSEYREIAVRRVKLGLILSKIGQEGKVTVAPDDLNKAIMAEAKKYPGQEKAVFDYYLKNPQAIESLKAPVFEEKIIDYVLGKADVKEKIISVEELYAFDEEGKVKKETKKKSADKSEEKEVKAEKKPASKKKA